MSDLEQARLAQLRSLGQLPHSGPSEALDAIAKIAAEVCAAPIALVSLVEEHDQFFKASRGFDMTQTPRDISFCTHAIEGADIYEVTDASEDALFADNPLVVDDDIRFYAGAPMTLTSGHRIGTVCVLDNEPRTLTEHQRRILATLAQACVSLFEEAAARRLQDLWVHRTLNELTDVVVSVDADGVVTSMNEVAEPFLASVGVTGIGDQLADTFRAFLPGCEPTTPIAECLATARAQQASDAQMLAMDDLERHDIEFSITPVVDDQQVAGAVLVLRDVSRERNLERRALIDGLTGAKSRYAFELLLTAHLDCEGPAGGAVVFFDLDRFKAVNDSLGHGVGDRLLREISLCASTLMGPGETLARVGGDEFAILMPTAGPAEVDRLAKALLREISHTCSQFSDSRADVSASLGVAMLDEAKLSFAEVLRRADAGCYRSKHGGGGRLTVFSPASQMAATSNENAGWINIVQSALTGKGLTLYGQRIKHDTERSDSIEVLLRLRYGGRIVTAGEFLTPVERSFLAPRVDEWVVLNTLRQLAESGDALNDFDLVHINLSARTIGDRPTADRIVQHVRTSDVPASKICFEITETVAITDLESVQDFVTTVQSLGCQFALDDFGRGFASFEHLKVLPLDIVKIDRMFVSDLATDPVSRHMVAAVQGVCMHLGITTVAEGVEESATVDELIKLGVDSAQGYLYHRPQPIAAVLAAGPHPQPTTPLRDRVTHPVAG